MDINSIKYTKVVKSIRKRYIFALSIIVLALILSQIIVQYNINNGMSYSRTINISGRQRMLSQKISKDVYAIYLADNKETIDFYINELESSIELWKKSNIYLQEGNLSEGISGVNSKEVKDMFLKIEEPHKIIINASNDIIHMVRNNTYDKSILLDKIRLIESNERIFLKGMDDIVFQYDLEAKEKILMIRNIEIALLVITLILILFEVLFIFMPAEKNIIRAFKEINESRKNFHKLFEVAPGAMFLVDYDTDDVILLNKQGEDFKHKLFGNAKELNIKNFAYSEAENQTELLEKIKLNEKIENQEMIIKTEAEKNIAMAISSIRLYFDKKSAILLAMADITNQKKEKEVLKKLASIDELTGLFNRRYGWTLLENLYLKAESGLVDFSICFIDIDGLKSVNDNLGHEEGDWYIKTITNCIEENVGNRGFVFRYGGDEVVVVFTDCDNGQASDILSKTEQKLRRIEVLENKSYKLSISFGIVSYNSDDEGNLEELVKKADYRMYENKKIKKVSR